ncbi:Transcriptional regulator, AraC family [Candidatus Burkholderia verschuerenii]|uniref:Transcriptional regulator, AraC family n=2 Tax=Candidatus Burkholderia verschuerenii TaxID=242163 RepID=A0A0L0M811_9BURK|nr:Transcriptional regulator, AraC family [Candidatus Burkholderia verschuerenii]
MLTRGVLGNFRSYGRQSETHIHEYVQAVLPVSGEMEMNAGGQSNRLTPSKAIILGPRTEHKFHSTRNGIFLVVDIRTDIALRNKKEIDEFVIGEITPSHQRLMKFLAEEFYRAPNDLFKCGPLFTALVDLIKQTSPKDIVLSEAGRHWNFGISETVQAAAKKYGMSETTFRRVVRRSFGDSPKRLQMEERLSHAEHLLISSDRPISSVAFDVGFKSTSSFTNAFRRIHGITPSDFRSIKRFAFDHADARSDNGPGGDQEGGENER